MISLRAIQTQDITIQAQNVVYTALGMLHKGNSYIDDQLGTADGLISSGVQREAVTNSADLLQKCSPENFRFNRLLIA